MQIRKSTSPKNIHFTVQDLGHSTSSYRTNGCPTCSCGPKPLNESCIWFRSIPGGEVNLRKIMESSKARDTTHIMYVFYIMLFACWAGSSFIKVWTHRLEMLPTHPTKIPVPVNLIITSTCIIYIGCHRSLKLRDKGSISNEVGLSTIKTCHLKDLRIRKPSLKMMPTSFPWLDPLFCLGFTFCLR